MAWQTALEGSCAAVLGNAMVGLLAENIFGYDLSNRDAESLSNPENQAALGKALALTVCFPWVICLAFYTMLHWSYPRDLQHAQRLRAAAPSKAGRKEAQEPCKSVHQLPPLDAEPCKPVECDEKLQS
mmetsp:Transcript_47216/g.146077  ORF Transcript_47216/g.146077 Transcript_47216/m.146077 type:complete len:128 (-) Transcript_47216:91-474(-)